MTPKISVSVPTPTLRAALEASDVAAHIELLDWDMSTPASVSEIDIVVPPYLLGSDVLRHLDRVRVRLVQWQSIGFDGVAEMIPDGVQFANATTVHETSTAELAVGLAIAMQRDFPRAMAAARERHWETIHSTGLADRRVLIVGYGGVGKAIESRLAPFETVITRVASSARTQENLAGDEVAVSGIEDLPELLRETDIVIIGLPLNESTRGLFDAAMLANLPDGALLVNVGRGPIVSTDALVSELNSGRLRAAIDVVDPEPLPSDHAIWGCPNLLITPHVGGDTDAMLPRVVRLVERQVRHLLAGERFENVVIG